MKKIFLIGAFIVTVFLPRLLDLGTILTVDEPLWLSRGQTFINGFSVGNFAKTLVAGQPGITTAWLVGLTAPWLSLTSGQLAIALASGTLVLITTYFLRILIGKKWGTITGLFLALDPFLIAHSRIAHTDALLALFYLASITSLLVALSSKNIQKRYIIMSAILGALAMLTKIFGVVLIPTTLFIIVYTLWRRKDDYLTIIRTAGLWLSVCCIAGFLAWPALWSHSDTVFTYLFSRASLHAEGTRSEEATSAPSYYVRETFFRLSIPVTILLPFAIWQWRTRTFSKHSAVTCTLVASGLVFALVLNNGSDKSDRYILFTHLTLVIAAPLGLRALTASKYLEKWSIALLVAPIIYLAADAIRLHPYYLAHYNRFYKIETDHKLGWGEGLEQAAIWIEKNHPGAKVLSYYPRVFDYFYSGEVDTILHINDATADYAVLYRSMFERGESAEETEIVNEFLKNTHKQPAHVISINGIPYAWIFKL